MLIGGVTRLSDDLISNKKQYLFEIKLGTQTDTLDCAGQVVKTASVPEDYRNKISSVLPQFLGEIQQVPPVYSALKMQGRPLYEYMRAQGKLPQDIETKKRIIFIEKINLPDNLQGEIHTIALRVMCGKGTYIRSLARDISEAIGTVGYCSALRREYVEPWHVDNAALFSQEKKPTVEEIELNLITPQALLPRVAVLKIPQDFLKLFSAGNVVTLSLNSICHASLELMKENGFCFAELEDKSVMYLAKVEILENELIKIKPSKKII